MISLDKTRLTDNLTAYYMTSYDDFAPLYDEATTTDNKAKVALFKTLIPPTATLLLELGCGTGTILQAFEHEYACTGLDLSPGMLAVAADKLSDVELIEGDMTVFDLGRQFDVILCVFNTMNHLLSFELWQQALSRAAAHLSPEGVFIFDVNTLKFFADRSADEAISQWFDDTEVISVLEPQADNIYEWSIAMIDGDGMQTQIYVPEVGFSLAQIQTAAEACFEEVVAITGTGKPVSESVNRVYFVCRLPRS